MDLNNIKILKTISVLYIDDDNSILETINKCLSPLCKKITTDSDNIAAFEKYKNDIKENLYDIIISDIKMPIINGINLSKKIKSINENISIILVSGTNDSELLKEAINLGIMHFIPKPIKIDLLIDTISKIANIIEKNKLIQREKNILYLSENIFWDKTSNELYDNFDKVKLTKSEVALISILIENINIKIHGSDLFVNIWIDDFKEYNPKSIRNLLYSIRRKTSQNFIENLYGSYYVIKHYPFIDTNKTKNLFDNELNLIDFSFILNQLSNGIVITNPRVEDNPAIFINNTFCNIFEYSHDEIIGRNLRFLHNNDTNQPAIYEIRNAIKKEIPITTIIRNYTKYGKLIQNYLSISPIFDADNKLLYFIGIQKALSSDFTI